MSQTSKSPLRILQAAHLLAKEVLPQFSHPCSPQKFTSPQLFACLVLKVSPKLDYREVAAAGATVGLPAVRLDGLPAYTPNGKSVAI